MSQSLKIAFVTDVPKKSVIVSIHFFFWDTEDTFAVIANINKMMDLCSTSNDVKHSEFVSVSHVIEYPRKRDTRYLSIFTIEIFFFFSAESPPPRRLATRSPAPADTVLPPVADLVKPAAATAVAAAFERDQMLQLHQKSHAATAPTNLSLNEHLERNAKSFIISNAFIICVVSLVIEIKA